MENGSFRKLSMLKTRYLTSVMSKRANGRMDRVKTQEGGIQVGEQGRSDEEWQDQFIRSLGEAIHLYHQMSPNLQELDIIDRVFDMCTLRIGQNLYSYCLIERELKQLNHLIAQYQSTHLSYINYTFGGRLMYEYNSFSLSIHYFKKALRFLNDSETIHHYQRKLEIIIYRTIAQILLQKGDTQHARHFGYKYLRKIWYVDDRQEQHLAYDLLGKIQFELNNLALSRYYHHRMCLAIVELNQLKKLSNLQLKRCQKINIQYLDNVLVFVKNDKIFNQIIINNYTSQSIEHQNNLPNQSLQPKRILVTHKSPNRKPNNYHRLNHKIITQQTSKQIHFVNKFQVIRIRKILLEYKKFMMKLKLNLEVQKRGKIV